VCFLCVSGFLWSPTRGGAVPPRIGLYGPHFCGVGKTCQDNLGILEGRDLRY
jgi:hypothetical protein